MATIAGTRRLAALALIAMAAPHAAIALAQPGAVAKPQAAGVWTLEEARAHLRLFPRDAYVQYVALQLARREGKLEEVAAEIGQRNPQWQDQRAMRRGQVDLFSIFSGQLAVQESLQLDALAPVQEGNEQPVAAAGRRRTGPLPLAGAAAGGAVGTAADTVAISDLAGPTVESHPWKKMLAGRTPNVTGLALSAPADFYFVSFRSMNKLLDAADVATLWGAHVFNQSNRDAQTQLVGDRLREQLCIEETPELRPFYDAVVDEVAIVGSDLFLREGSDVTMLFHVKQPAVFRVQMDQLLTAAANSRDDAKRNSEGKCLGIGYEEVATPDRRIHVYSAYPRPDLHVRSNSRAALQRVLGAIVGPQQGVQRVERLGETDEFRYVRTLLPSGAPEEDGLVYLSDPFVRRMMSPALRLTERRRMVCYNHLRMIGHAGLMYRTQTGKVAGSLAALTAADCAPGEFGKGKFACPEHGEYALAADGLTGVCSHHGYASYLTPCDEIETTRVTEVEAAAYRQFVTEYNQYWRQFFDPIAIRLQITPERYRAETIVLPLIDNSIYTNLAQSLGGEPEPLDALPVPKRSIFSFAVRLNKAAMLHSMRLDHLIAANDPQRENMQAKADAARTAGAMRQILVGMLNYETAHKQFPPASKNGLSWRVHILPYLEQEALYREFHLDEPWDSPHNRELIKRMPEIYQPSIDKLRRAGRTKYVVPRGEGTIFGDGVKGASLQELSDGLSNTIALVECDDEHAVQWTRPDDIEITPREARRELQWRESDVFLVATADGSVQALQSSIDPGILAGMLTPAGGETGDWRQFASVPPEFRQPPGYRDLHAETLESLGIGELVTNGVGNQLGFHVYDAEPMFDLSLTRFMGMTMGSLRGSRGIDNDFLFLFPLVGALNGPVYVSIPVKDREVVDAFLERLDGYLAELATREEQGWLFSVDQDFYHLPDVDGRQVRAYGFGCGPLKWRFFWSRIDDALYIASKREVLDDLAALAAEGPAKNSPPAGSSRDPETTAHALVRLRPQNWDQVLGAYRLGWEENNRQACLKNLGPLGGISRALASGSVGGESVAASDLELYAARVYDVHHFCPDGGHYEIAADGRSVSCTAHGTMREPRQTEAPAEASELGKLLTQFSDMTITLTFLEDGLHAVATLERKPASDK